MGITKIKNEKDLIRHGLQPGDEGVWYGAVFFHKDGNLYDFNGYNPSDSIADPRSRIKKRSKVVALWRIITIGAVIDALMIVSYISWEPFGFLASVAEP